MDNRHVNPKQFIVIPAGILHDKNISSNAKLLYGMILSLSRKNNHDDFGELGVCYSNNNYLAHNLDLSRETITKCILRVVLRKGKKGNADGSASALPEGDCP